MVVVPLPFHSAKKRRKKSTYKIRFFSEFLIQFLVLECGYFALLLNNVFQCRCHFCLALASGPADACGEDGDVNLASGGVNGSLLQCLFVQSAHRRRRWIKTLLLSAHKGVCIVLTQMC